MWGGGRGGGGGRKGGTERERERERDRGRGGSSKLVDVNCERSLIKTTLILACRYLKMDIWRFSICYLLAAISLYFMNVFPPSRLNFHTPKSLRFYSS